MKLNDRPTDTPAAPSPREASERSALVAALWPWQESVFRILYRVLGSTHDAEDVWQTLMVRLLRTPSSLPASTQLAAWLRRCAVNEAISFLRRKESKSRPLTDDLAAEAPAAIEKLADGELSSLVLAALTECSASQRALLALRFDEGLTIREIAAVVEQPCSTVHFQLNQAIEKLRRRLNLLSPESTQYESMQSR